MLYRRKFLFALLELLGGETEKLRLQKLAFLFGQRGRALYDFVAYKFGSFSISMAYYHTTTNGDTVHAY